MSTLREILEGARIIEQSSLAEFSRWGRMETATTPPATIPLDKAVEAIRELLENDDPIDLRETDLNAVRHFLANRQVGTLHLSYNGQSGKSDVAFAVLPTGEYMIPFKSESLDDLISNGQSFLSVHDTRIYLGSPRNIYYGNTKAFTVFIGILDRAQLDGTGKS